MHDTKISLFVYPDAQNWNNGADFRYLLVKKLSIMLSSFINLIIFL